MVIYNITIYFFDSAKCTYSLLVLKIFIYTYKYMSLVLDQIIPSSFIKKGGIWDYKFTIHH